MDIGSRIRKARKNIGLTQEDLARRADISLFVVSRLERGETSDPHVSNLQSIAHALGVPVGELLGEGTPPSPKDPGIGAKDREEVPEDLTEVRVAKAAIAEVLAEANVEVQYFDLSRAKQDALFDSAETLKAARVIASKLLSEKAAAEQMFQQRPDVFQKLPGSPRIALMTSLLTAYAGVERVAKREEAKAREAGEEGRAERINEERVSVLHELDRHAS